jgi:hypothetical protein
MSYAAGRMVGMTPENVAGLVVGEGCFYAENAPDPKYRSGWRIRPAFWIEMRHDDREVLDGVRDHLGCGNVYHLDFGRYRGCEAQRVAATREVSGEQPPRPARQRRAVLSTPRSLRAEAKSIRALRGAVEMLVKGEHRDPLGLARAKELAMQLTKHNRKG